VKRLLFLSAVLGAGALVTASTALAAAPSFAIRPVTFRPSVPATQSYFIFDASPGRTINSLVRVTNAGTATGSALLYPVDAVTGQTSGAVYLSRTARRRDVGRWTRLGVTRVTLAPHESKVVPFTVTVPTSTRPGSHLGGIVAENLAVEGASKGTNGSSFQIRVRHLSIVAVEVDLPGAAVERLGLGAVTTGSAGTFPTAVLALRNRGTVILKPRGSIRIVTSDGRALEQRAFQLDTFVPQTGIHYPVVLRKRLGAGTYRADVTLTYGHGRVLHAIRTFGVSREQARRWLAGPAAAAASPPAGRGTAILPWLVAGGGIALALAAVVFAVRTRRPRRASAQPSDRPMCAARARS
jgi:hypothetical protein